MREWTAEARARIIRQGPCRICGQGYAAHRMIDTMMERTAAGDAIESVAEDYDMSVGDMVTLWCALVDLSESPPPAP